MGIRSPKGAKVWMLDDGTEIKSTYGTEIFHLLPNTTEQKCEELALSINSSIPSFHSIPCSKLALFFCRLECKSLNTEST